MRARLTATQVAQAFRDACLAELDALKPGNVHRFGDDPRMSVTDFETSARVAAAPLAQAGASVGERIRASVAATIAAVGHNTNLGIVLLSAPLASAALSDEAGDLRQRLAKVLAGLTVEDAKEAYAAIRLANPGGLGEVPRHGVDAEPAITLLEAMKAAEGHDRIAWNYSHDFADIFDLGSAALQRGGKARVAGAFRNHLRVSRLPFNDPRHLDRAEIRTAPKPLKYKRKPKPWRTR